MPGCFREYFARYLSEAEKAAEPALRGLRSPDAFDRRGDPQDELAGVRGGGKLVEADRGLVGLRELEDQGHLVASFAVFDVEVLLIAFSFWLFVALPFLNSTPQRSDQHQAAQYTSETSGTENKPKEPFWQRATDDPVAVFTLALVIFTFVLAVSTIGLWIVTWRAGVRQSKDMLGAIAAAEAANKLNREHFILGERPWLKPEIKIASPLYFDGKSATITLEVTVKNVGRTPAFKVHPFVWVHYDGTGLGPIELHRQYSQNIKKFPMREADSGRVLFPGESDVLNKAQTFARWDWQQIELAKAKGSIDENYFAPGIVVCIDYASVLRDVHYQTTRIFVLFRAIQEAKGIANAWGSFKLDQAAIPESELFLAPHPIGSITT